MTDNGATKIVLLHVHFTIFYAQRDATKGLVNKGVKTTTTTAIITRLKLHRQFANVKRITTRTYIPKTIE